MIQLVAEIGINHNGDMNIARKLIDIAAFAGFNSVKFQKRTPELCVPEHQKTQMRKTPWGEMTYLEYRNRIEFSIDQYCELAEYSCDRGVGFFASVWDIESAHDMATIVDIVKIPSAKIIDEQLLRYCRDNFEVLIMSTGMSTEEEIARAIDTARPDIILHSNASYPTAENDVCLEYISWLKRQYPGVKVGYSGHELGISTTMAAAALGAEMIERHVTLDKRMWGSDQAASIDPVEMIRMVQGVRTIEKALAGDGPRVLCEAEKAKRESLRG
jgi:N-acetylneuraminate synthase